MSPPEIDRKNLWSAVAKRSDDTALAKARCFQPLRHAQFPPSPAIASLHPKAVSSLRLPPHSIKRIAKVLCRTRHPVRLMKPCPPEIDRENLGVRWQSEATTPLWPKARCFQPLRTRPVSTLPAIASLHPKAVSSLRLPPHSIKRIAKVPCRTRHHVGLMKPCPPEIDRKNLWTAVAKRSDDTALAKARCFQPLRHAQFPPSPAIASLHPKAVSSLRLPPHSISDRQSALLNTAYVRLMKPCPPEIGRENLGLRWQSEATTPLGQSGLLPAVATRPCIHPTCLRRCLAANFACCTRFGLHRTP